MSINSKNRAYSDQAASISVSRDSMQNEIPSDQPNHTDTTAGKGAFHWTGNQYDDSVGKSGFGSYGTSVADQGKSSSEVSVNVSRADRGKEA